MWEKNKGKKQKISRELNNLVSWNYRMILEKEFVDRVFLQNLCQRGGWEYFFEHEKIILWPKNI